MATTTIKTYEVGQYVLAQGDSGGGEFYAPYPAIVMEKSINYFICDWVDPKGIWNKPPEAVHREKVKDWNEENLTHVFNHQLPNADKSDWRHCAIYADEQMGKICRCGERRE